MARLERPQPFGRYELLRRIGAGGMGEVFLARLPGLGGADKVCVVKKILPHLSEDQGFVGRFVDEGKVVVHLAHGNIAQVFEMGEVDGQFFMAMEYVEGKTLQKVESRLRERNQSFPVDLALWICAQACAGLAYAHRKTDPTGKPLQVVHRDISPSNLMVTYDGEVKIIDFGAALSSLKEEMTAPRVVIGNLSYMAPEHARKQKVDQRADIFSLGVVLWELLSWQQIPTDGDHVERWKRAARPSFTRPSSFRDGIPMEVDRIVMRALSADPRDRHPDAETLREELLTALTRVAPQASNRSLGGFMRTLFEPERAAERRIIADALVDPSTLRLPAGMVEAFTEAPRPPVVSDPTPMPLSLRGTGSTDFTIPGGPALSVGRGELPESMRPTSPGRPGLVDEADTADDDEDLTLEATSIERRSPRSAPVAVSEVSVTPEISTTPPLPAIRRVQRTGAGPVEEPPAGGGQTYLWVGVGVVLGFGLVALMLTVLGGR